MTQKTWNPVSAGNAAGFGNGLGLAARPPECNALPPAVQYFQRRARVSVLQAKLIAELLGAALPAGWEPLGDIAERVVAKSITEGRR